MSKTRADMGTVTLRITEREKEGWVIAHIVTGDYDFQIAACNATLRAQPVIYAAWKKLLQSVIDDFAAFNGLSDLISDTTTEVKHRGDA